MRNKESKLLQMNSFFITFTDRKYSDLTISLSVRLLRSNLILSVIPVKMGIHKSCHCERSVAISSFPIACPPMAEQSHTLMLTTRLRNLP